MVWLQGSLGDLNKLRSDVLIYASDDPYGVIVVSAVSQPVRVLEADSSKIECTIIIIQTHTTHTHHTHTHTVI